MRIDYNLLYCATFYAVFLPMMANENTCSLLVIRCFSVLKRRKDTDQPIRCSSELAKQRKLSCSLKSLRERKEIKEDNKERKEHREMARK